METRLLLRVLRYKRSEDVSGARNWRGALGSVREFTILNNNVLERLREAGMRLALDDFGTGYSSLDYLRRFPMDRIKISQNFVLDLDRPGSAAVVRATIGLAANWGSMSSPKAVETAAQLHLLQSWGCREVQGY